MGFPESQFERCSGGGGACRRGTGEQGKGAEGTWTNHRRKGFQHGDNRSGRRRGRCLHQMDGDVSGNAERAVRVRGGVRMGVGNLYRARNHNEKDADEREEDSPGASRTRFVASQTHLRPLYRSVRKPARRTAQKDRASQRKLMNPLAVPACQKI